MIRLSDDEVRKRLPWPTLIAAIEAAVAGEGAGAPPRVSYELTADSGEPGHLLIMPAWQGASVIGIKTVTFWPDNERYGRPSHGANYIVMDGRTAEVLAVLDAGELTARRTAAVSVIAAKRLARPDARNLLVVGAGPVALELVDAHTASHGFASVELYARDRSKAEAAVARLASEGIDCRVCDDLEASARRADVISMATSAQAPVLQGEWLAPGVHVEMVGSFTPAMRETDDTLMRRAAGVWVDTSVALQESGDLVHPLENGALSRDKLRGDLKSLILAPSPERDAQDITVFKAVGFAVPDLAAAKAALQDADAAPGRKSA